MFEPGGESVRCQNQHESHFSPCIFEPDDESVRCQNLHEAHLSPCTAKKSSSTTQGFLQVGAFEDLAVQLDSFRDLSHGDISQSELEHFEPQALHALALTVRCCIEDHLRYE